MTSSSGVGGAPVTGQEADDHDLRQRQRCAEDGDGGLCETDDERNAREYGLPVIGAQEGWLCWRCCGEVRGEVGRTAGGCK